MYLFQYRRDPLLDSRSAYLVKGALQNLSEFMSTVNERENKDRQKLLRNLRVNYYLWHINWMYLVYAVYMVSYCLSRYWS